MDIRRELLGEEDSDGSESLPVDDTSDDDSRDNDLKNCGEEFEDGPSIQGCEDIRSNGVLWLGSVWRQLTRRSLHSPERTVLSLQSGSPSSI